uniref:Reverse transcriptase domain-containing protein n=1 Tax=Xenopus tropicalis TaxID=8364 RepID=A0A803J3K6_XENTR
MEEAVGGRLLKFRGPWLQHTTDTWVHNIVTDGYKLQFRKIPPPRFLTSKNTRDPVLKAVKELLLSNTITPVPRSQRHQGFYSNLFLIPKKDGSLRPVLDLKRLNTFLHVPSFKMESLRSVISNVEKGDFFTSIDLKDAYLHIPIHVDHQHTSVHTNTRGTRVEDTSHQKLPTTISIHRIPRSEVRRYTTQSILDNRKSDQHHNSRKADHGTTTSKGQKMHETPRPNDLGHRNGSLRPISHENPTVGVHKEMARGPPQSRNIHYPIPGNKRITPLVVHGAEPSKRKTVLGPVLAHSYHGRQPLRMGRCIRTQKRTRYLVPPGNQTTHQYSGTQSRSAVTKTLGRVPKRPSGESQIRQCDNGRIYQSPRRHTQYKNMERSHKDPILGRVQRLPPTGSLHTRGVEQRGRLPKPKYPRPGRMVIKQGGIPPTHDPVGQATSRPHGNEVQQPSTSVLLQVPGPASHSDRRNDHDLGFRSSIHFPANPHDSPGPEETPDVPNYSNSHNTILAPQGMVLRPKKNGDRPAMALTEETRPPTTGTLPTSQPNLAFPDGMVIETSIWRDKGFSDKVTNTLMQARKRSTSVAYHRVWLTYISWCNQRALTYTDFQIHHILEFLQKGLDLGLGVSSLKVQISSLSILFQKPIASHPDVRTFIQAAGNIRPPYRQPIPPWNLNIILRALQEPPFEPMASISLKLLTWKTAFLVAISSARRVSEMGALSHKPPFCIFHQDKVVLRTVPSFRPKVASEFHLNQEIVLPSLCPNPANGKERLLHNLDVVRALKFYIHRTRNIRKSEALVLLYGSRHHGNRATKISIARWIKDLITMVYRSRDLEIPFKVSAHSTRGLSTSWALHNQASMEQICKAATWASLHTFTKFYQFNVYASADAAFGRKVLQTVTSS